MKRLKNELSYALYTVLVAVLSSRLVGFIFIFFPIHWLGKTELWSWEMWAQTLLVSFGGSILINNGRKDCN